MKKEVKLSSKFKSETSKSIAAIVLFIVVYVFLLVIALGFSLLCVLGGLGMIVAKPMFFTIALGLGLAGLGILVLIFLVKFIFKSHKIDRSHLVEIKESDQPELFAMIHEIVQEVGTTFPKRVYLSSEVNASVFYDSSFWSMFLPVKKNLMIGLGLVNSITREELRAILSHEFGHFSQQTMKVGSYVYYVNQIIHNMLNDNEGYEKMVHRWANISGYFSIFTGWAVQIVNGIQWILRKMYEVVNKSYLALSREMEFHADEIAASVTGYEPLKSSLMRMSLADNSFNQTVNFYNNRIEENIKSENLYQDHWSLMHFLSESKQLKLRNSLPEVTFEHYSKFDKSKLVIKDQWASHPTVKERVDRLEQTGFNSQATSDGPANEVFIDIEKWQKRLTEQMFSSVMYPGEVQQMNALRFLEAYQEEFSKNSFSKKYNGYYNDKNPVVFDLETVGALQDDTTPEQLFSDDWIDTVYTSLGLHQDLETLRNIVNKTFDVKTFDYDGKRYKSSEAKSLLESLSPISESLLNKIKEHDILIYQYFIHRDSVQNQSDQLKQLYAQFFAYDLNTDKNFEIYTNLIEGLQFIHEETPFDIIRDNFERLKVDEEVLKKILNQYLHDDIFQDEIAPAFRESIEAYTSENLTYFVGKEYRNDKLEILHTAMHQFLYLSSRKYFLLKRKLLAYQSGLM